MSLSDFGMKRYTCQVTAAAGNAGADGAAVPVPLGTVFPPSSLLSPPLMITAVGVGNGGGKFTVSSAGVLTLTTSANTDLSTYQVTVVYCS